MKQGRGELFMWSACFCSTWKIVAYIQPVIQC